MLSKCDNIRFYAYKSWSASLFLLLYMYSVRFIFLHLNLQHVQLKIEHAVYEI